MKRDVGHPVAFWYPYSMNFVRSMSCCSRLGEALDGRVS